MRCLQVQQHVQELQHSVALVKTALGQFRSEVEAERSERWRVDSERNQWLADLRAAVAKVDASMDAKIIHHVERLNSKLTTDKMDVMRLLEEHRALVTGADFKRVSSQMLEFSRINDHLLALERWIHTEFGHIKRVFQFVLADTDGRLEAITVELVASMKNHSAMLFRQEDEQAARLQDLHDAVLEATHAMQKKLFALEDVLPMEVKARQQNDDKIRARVESVVKALSRAIEATRDECVVPQAQLKTRMKLVEDAQREIVDQVDEKHEIVKQTIRTFLQDSDAMLARLAESVELERRKTLAVAEAPSASGTSNATVLADEPAAVVAAAKASVETPGILSVEPTLLLLAAAAPGDELAATAPQSTAEHPPEWVAYFESQVPSRLEELRSSLLGDVDRKLGELAERSATRELAEQQVLAVEGLRAWTASHAQECGQCYEYLNWAVDSMRTDEDVRRCLAAMIDLIADAAALEEFQTLEDNTSWVAQQLTAMHAQQQLQGASFRSLQAVILPSDSESGLGLSAPERGNRLENMASAGDLNDVAAESSQSPATAGDDTTSSGPDTPADDDPTAVEPDTLAAFEAGGSELWL